MTGRSAFSLPRPTRIRTWIAIALVLAICLTVMCSVLGLMTVGEWLSARLLAQLPADAQRAVQMLDAGKLPSRHDYEMLVEAERPLRTLFDILQGVLLVTITAIAAAVGVIASLFLARRITVPMEAVAQAARQIASGRLSTRATPAQAAMAGEARQLVDDFNQMASSLERYEREMREASAAVAHELRTPLTVLRGRLQGLRDGVFEQTEAEIDGLIGQVDALSHLVDDLQIVSLAANGSLRLRTRGMDLATEVAELVETLRPELEANGFALSLALPATPIQADPLRIRQAALALIDNVRRHASSGRALSVEVEATADIAILRVADRGPGMPDVPQQRLFERFWSGDDARRLGSAGSGLGLSVVAAIAAAHGGTVTAHPRDGGGMIIELALPRRSSQREHPIGTMVGIKVPTEAPAITTRVFLSSLLKTL